MTRLKENWMLVAAMFLFAVSAIRDLSSCNAAPLASYNTAPLVEASAEVNADVSAQLLRMQATIDKLRLEVGGLRAGRDINDVSGRILAWSVGATFVITALGAVAYAVLDRWPTTRWIKDVLKGKTCEAK